MHKSSPAMPAALQYRAQMHLHRPKNLRAPAATIVTLTVMVAVFDLWTSAELVGSILFTFPLALCALQPSRRLLWCTAAAAAVVTIAAEFWGFDRTALPVSWVGAGNRCLLVASLLTLTTFIHLWMKQLQQRALVQEALRESEESYRLLLDGVQDYAIYMMDPQGRIVSWNAGAQRIKGYTAGQIVGRNFSCFFPAEDVERGRPQQVLRMTAAAGRHEEQSMRVRKDGSQFLASVTFTALHDAAGKLRGFSEFSHDLSESTASEAKYRGLLEAAPDAMVVVSAGGDIVLLNVQAENQFGYRRDELVGQAVTNIIPEGFAERLIADGTRTAAEALAQQIGTGIELTGRRKDRSEFPIEIMLSPLESVDGILVTAAIRDVSARKKAEEALLASKERLQMAVEVAEMGTWFRNIRQNKTIWSDKCRALFGVSADAALSHQVFLNVTHPDDRQRIEQAIQKTLDLGAPYELEYRVVWPDASVHWLATKGRAHRSPQGVPEHMEGIVMDITKRKESDALLSSVTELKRSNEELGQFAYVASHDLQEPLRMVASYTQLLSRRYKGKLDADADEFIAFAVDGATRMQRLIQDLLAYSRIGTQEIQMRDISSEDALRQSLANLGGAIEDSGALVTHDPLPAVQADDVQLIQLFQNLIGNAVKYQSPGIPRIHVSAARKGANEWVFSIQDNGLGIDAQYFERIFGMFQRLHKREEFAGTGIGLAICRKIVERHGGKISVVSQPGKGSTFSFSLSGTEGNA